MAKFIHLSLLLAATAQLPVTAREKKVTFRFPSSWTVEYCCRDNRCTFVGGFTNNIVSVTKSDLTIKNLKNDNNRIYSCYGDSNPPIHTDLLLCLKITGCQSGTSCSVEFLDHLHLIEDDCKGTCQSRESAFDPINYECHQESSCNNVMIKFNHAVSGDCFSYSYIGNAATAQLPVRKEVTFNFHPNWTVEYCCRDNRCKFVGERFTNNIVSVTNSYLTIKNLKNDNNRIYSCYGDSKPPIHTDLLLCLKITGCQSGTSCSVEFLDHLHLIEDDCKGTCQSREPAFDPINYECHQESSCNNVMIKFNHSVSGDCFGNSYSGNDVEYDPDPQFYQEAKSWIDALEHCQNLKSSLVQITNQAVQASVNSSLINKTNSMPNGTWIGLERSIFGKSNVPWKWISGTQVEDPPWNGSFPVDALNHHCGKIIWVKNSEQFKWLDACCHEELPFICQRGPP